MKKKLLRRLPSDADDTYTIFHTRIAFLSARQARACLRLAHTVALINYANMVTAAVAAAVAATSVAGTRARHHGFMGRFSLTLSVSN